ncbi:MAG: DUF2235 domain-containing protein [Vicinamibacterales bacterium]
MKRIVICADGTWNVRDQTDDDTGKRRPTNVTKVARAIRPRGTADGVDQVVLYHDGIGTGGPLDRLSGGAFGRGIEDNIRTLYRFIVYNYAPGDELYFFGFSRGAFTVRTLAGFMKFVGLVEKDHDYFVPDLYECYEKSKGPGTPEWDHAHRKIENKRPCPQIRFIGVWDTVGALGAPGVLGQVFNRNKYEYHDVGLSDAIENAYHALAIDERRKPFSPTLWERPISWGGMLEQVWFAGVHSNIGGGYWPDGLANEALHWIVEKAEGLGLEVDGDYLSYFKPCFNSTLHDSMSLKFRLMGQHVRPIGQHSASGERVHQSAMDRRAWDRDYRPKNLEAYLSSTPGATFAQTTRCPRGKPC